jgi:menaquinol-cytochrome c reductase iron-sulfur subunit
MINEERRSFLRWAIYGLSALFSAVLGVPAVAYLADARNRPAPNRGFRKVEGVSLKELRLRPPNTPMQGVIRDVRRDAWTLSEGIIGRVWVWKTPDNKFEVFTTICPHLGCSINLDPPGSDGKSHGFTCPCHGGKFHVDGKLNTDVPQNPAPRGMDALQCRVDPADPDVLQVVYQNFYQGRHDQVVKA